MPEVLMPTSYNTALVVLSYVIAVVGSYIALSATQNAAELQGQAFRSRMLLAGMALGGIGVWAMHFVGMLALQMPLGMSYSMIETAISLIAAVLATAWALAVVARNPNSKPRLLLAGTVLGLGVCLMHYLGMYGMRFGGFFRWDALLVLLSVLIALAAATAALWLAFNTNSQLSRIGAALVMGLAVCAMHYTGMLAADIICTTTEPQAIPRGPGWISVLDLPMLVIALIVGMTMAMAIQVVYTLQPQKRRRTHERSKPAL